MFKVIEDPKQMDALWEAGLLWYRIHGTGQWVVDTTGLRPSAHTDVPYAILIEE